MTANPPLLYLLCGSRNPTATDNEIGKRNHRHCVEKRVRDGSKRRQPSCGASRDQPYAEHPTNATPSNKAATELIRSGIAGEMNNGSFEGPVRKLRSKIR